MLINKEQVLEFLPHRPPFLFVDSIEEIILSETFDKANPQVKDLIGTKVIGHFHVAHDLEILRGHFPGDPILPGVIQVEMMAQVAAFISLALCNFQTKNIEIETKLIGVDRARYRKPLTVGMDLVVHSVLTKTRMGFNYYDCVIYHNDEVVAETSILAILNFLDQSRK
jgi:3-hydroxyacyl-[acyl-carrier-protein] dehydratase